MQNDPFGFYRSFSSNFGFDIPCSKIEKNMRSKTSGEKSSFWNFDLGKREFTNPIPKLQQMSHEKRGPMVV